MPITGKTRLLGVIGYPVEHSLSPVMHNAALAALKANFVYVPFAIAPGDFAPAIAGMAALGIHGFSITIPHKQAILPYLTEISPSAQAIGAVNTVWRGDSGWHGTNTDVLGFLSPLRALSRDWSGSTVLILGCGGAARAVVAACCELGCAAIQVVGRNPEKLDAFLRSWQGSALAPPMTVHPWGATRELLPQADLIVNTTPIGMHPQVDASPLTPAQMDQVSPQAIAYDLIYTPQPTQFLALAQQRGLTTLDGLEMLVQQGAAALEIWLQSPVPVAVMRQALYQQLGLEPLNSR